LECNLSNKPFGIEGARGFVPGTLTFYRPGTGFPAFSVTGERCELRCEHCQGRYLKGMRAMSGPPDLVTAALALEAAGGTGFLLSGGCDPRGQVPLEPFLGAVGEIKRATALAVNLHPGLVDRERAGALLASGADAFSVDVLQDRRAIAGGLHLDAGPEAYARTLELLSPGHVVPHVCVGLQSEEGERATIELLSRHRIAGVVVLGLMAPPGSGLRPVPPGRLARFIRAAVREIDAPVVVGCMRPRGRWEEETELIEAGAAGVVNPSPAAAEWARVRGYDIVEKKTCCALHR
jgi:uncharacterized radical SAM superfamily protein